MDDWLILFRRAMALLDQAPPGLIGADWTLGGGTMLYRRFRHRLSRDIDIFLTTPQAMAALSPRLNDAAARHADRPGASYVEQSHFLKLASPEGDIDFIVAPHLLVPHATPERIDGRDVLVETPAEILAKKILYRAADFTARDLFDFALLIETGDAQAVLGEAAGLGRSLQDVAGRLDMAGPALRASFGRIPALAFRPGYDEAERLVRAFIARSRP